MSWSHRGWERGCPRCLNLTLEVGVAGAPLHDRIEGAEEQDGISCSLLNNSSRLGSDTGGEGVGASCGRGLRAQVNSGGELRGGPVGDEYRFGNRKFLAIVIA